jgi:hypothetical protein
MLGWDVSIRGLKNPLNMASSQQVTRTLADDFIGKPHAVVGDDRTLFLGHTSVSRRSAGGPDSAKAAWYAHQHLMKC